MGSLMWLTKLGKGTILDLDSGHLAVRGWIVGKWVCLGIRLVAPLALYGLPWLLLQLPPLGSWICLSICSVVIFWSLYGAARFFDKEGDWDEAYVLDFSLESLEDWEPDLGLVFWFARYVNLAFWFGVVCAAVQSLSGQTAYAALGLDRLSLFDFVYFSFVTITTLGYGDVTPVSGLAKALVIVEIVGGLWLLLTCVATTIQYMGEQRKKDN
jgi:hypothetical protein